MNETEKNRIAHRIERMLLDNGFIHMNGNYYRGSISVEIEKTYGLRDLHIFYKRRVCSGWSHLATVPYCPDGTDQHRPYLQPETIIRCILDIVECGEGEK